jgi:hypothetical protein
VEVDGVGPGMGRGETIVGELDALILAAEVDCDAPVGLEDGYAPNSSVTCGGSGEFLLDGA